MVRYCFYSDIYYTGWKQFTNNLLICILRIVTSLGLVFNHEFYFRLLGLTDVYNNGKTVPTEYPMS